MSNSKSNKEGEHKIGFINPKDCDLLDYIVKGEKIVEGRKMNDKIKSMKKGDTLIIKTNTKNVECKIEDVVVYKTFEEYLKKEKVSEYMPCVKTVDEARKIYESFNKDKPIDGEYVAIKIKFLKQVFYRGVKEPWFSYIKNKKKKIEGRLSRGSFTNMQKGDEIVWVNNKELVPTLITKIEKFKSFIELIEKSKLEDLLPGIKSKEEALKIYREFYPEDVEKEVGEVLAIHLKKLDE